MVFLLPRRHALSLSLLLFFLRILRFYDLYQFSTFSISGRKLKALVIFA